MDKRPVVPTYCYFKWSGDSALATAVARSKELCYKYNQLSPTDEQGRQTILNELIGSVGKNAMIMPPFWCDYGYNITLGDNFFANHNLIITDGAKVTFGEHVFIAPNCCFTTAEHAIDPDMRREDVEVAMPITVGNNVWIGAGTTVLAGVTIGDNSVIGAGSVVRKSIPSGVVAVGVPCKPLRKITEADKRRYPVFDGEL